MDKKKLTIVIPCYNEEESLPIVLKDLIPFCENHNFQLIIVNDGSNDETIKILNNTKSDILQVISHKLNKGYGAAIKTGILFCDTKYAITIDADGQHLLDDIVKMLTLIVESDADMIVGSRQISEKPSAFRRFGKGIIRTVAKLLMKIPIWDINSGMKIYNVNLAKQYINLCPDGMSFSDIITLIFISKKHLVLEYSINIKQRLAGKSKIGISTAFETILSILSVVMLFNPLRIFLPLSILFFITGIAWGIRFVILNRGISVASSMLIILSALIFLLGLIAQQLSEIRKSDIYSNKK